MMNNPIFEYYQAIRDGSANVGRWTALGYEYIIKGLENKSFYYSPKKANRAIRFIENFVHHHEGALAPQLLKLELWQKAFIAAVFGIVDENNHRQFREVILTHGRKGGKTLLAAAIAEYCIYADGEYGARVYFCAPKLIQANLCYDAFYQSIKQEPVLDALTQKRRTDIYVEATNSSAQPIPFSSKKSDGFNISLAVCDEIAAWQGEGGLKFYEVIKSSFGSRTQPLLLSITTAGYENDGIYDELMRRATRVLLGDSKETRLLPILYMIDDPSKWNDINEIQKANPNLGVSVSIDYMLEEIAIAEGSLSKRNEFLTKYCNLKQNSSQAWLDYKIVDSASGEHIALDSLANSYAVAGLDLSQTTDLTSACIVVERAGKLNIVSHFWMPSNRIEQATAEDGVPYEIFRQQGFLTLSGENYVNYDDVFIWFADLIRRYKIYPLKVGYDRYSAQYLVEKLKGIGLHCDDVFQGFNLSSVIKEFEATLKDGTVNIGDNNLLKSHLLNAALKFDNDSQRVKLIKVGRNKRIDGCAAVIDAMTMRSKWASEIGNQLRNRTR